VLLFVSPVKIDFPFPILSSYAHGKLLNIPLLKKSFFTYKSAPLPKVAPWGGLS